jgi:phospholipase D1/2
MQYLTKIHKNSNVNFSLCLFIFQEFKVIIIVPVHPEGGFKNSATVRYIMGWQYKTICRGGESMVESFNRTFPGVDVTKYFHFYIVQNWARMGNTLVTEQIYVHAKLMIIDDRTVIIGSANINDRSMIGVRDSEIGVVVNDSITLDSTMNGVPVKVAKYAHELRCNLFLEHLGLSPNQMYMVKVYEIGQIKEISCRSFFSKLTLFPFFDFLGSYMS